MFIGVAGRNKACSYKEVLVYQYSDARNKIKNVPFVSTFAKSKISIRTLMEEVELVFRDKWAFQKETKSL